MRKPLLAGLALLLALPLNATAAPAPLVGDPSGDALVPHGGWDIVSADLSTTGVVTKAKGKSSYTPTHLVATVTFLAPPDKDHLNVRLVAHHDSCDAGRGYVWEYSGSGGTSLVRESAVLDTSSCGVDREFLPVTGPVITGNKATWRVPLDRLKRHIKVGSRFSDLRVYTHLQGPLVLGTADVHEGGLLVNGLGHSGPNGAVDLATSTREYVVR